MPQPSKRSSRPRVNDGQDEVSPSAGTLLSYEQGDHPRGLGNERKEEDTRRQNMYYRAAIQADSSANFQWNQRC